MFGVLCLGTLLKKRSCVAICRNRIQMFERNFTILCVTPSVERLSPIVHSPDPQRTTIVLNRSFPRSPAYNDCPQSFIPPPPRLTPRSTYSLNDSDHSTQHKLRTFDPMDKQNNGIDFGKCRKSPAIRLLALSKAFPPVFFQVLGTSTNSVRTSASYPKNPVSISQVSKRSVIKPNIRGSHRNSIERSPTHRQPHPNKRQPENASNAAFFSAPPRWTVSPHIRFQSQSPRPLNDSISKKLANSHPD